LDDRGLIRALNPLTMTGPTTAIWAGKPVTLFCSNDYLGLAQEPQMRAAWSGAGTGSARLISGDRPVHHQLEERLAQMYEQPVTLMSSGYHANLALLTTLLDKTSLVVSDALNHASIIDGIRMSGAEKIIQPHLAEGVPDDVQLAVFEGIYSMDGDCPDFASLVGEHWLAVDEAHAFGVLGPQGKGVAALQGVRPDFMVGTLGKALGAYGAFVVGPKDLHTLIRSKGRSFIFTTGIPEPVAAAALVGLQLATDARREKLQENVARMRSGLSELGLRALGRHHIIPLVLGAKTMRVASKLRESGHYVVGIRPPTVPVGQERIRLTVSAAHTPEQIDGLLEALGRMDSAA